MNRPAIDDEHHLSETIAEIVVRATVVAGVLMAALGLFLTGAIVVGVVPVPAVAAVAVLGLMAYGGYETWGDWRDGRARPGGRRRGLLGDAGEAIKPFAYWSFLGLFGFLPLVLAVLVVALGILGDEPGLTLLALIPAGIGLACTRSWHSWRRDQRRHHRR